MPSYFKEFIVKAFIVTYVNLWGFTTLSSIALFFRIPCSLPHPGLGSPFDNPAAHGSQVGSIVYV